jgi:hypothetical protein
MNQDKRRHRELKRQIKRAGKRQLRRHLKQTIGDEYGSAADAAFEYGRNSSASLNGNDHDATRRRDED